MARSRSSGGRRGALVGGGSPAQSGVSGVLKFRVRRLNTYRGTAANEFGDLDDVGTLYLTGVQAAIAETSDQVFDPSSQRMQTIRTLTCIVPAWADIVDTDTIHDPATGYFYMVNSIEQRPGIGMYPAEKILSLRMRSGVSIGSD